MASQPIPSPAQRARAAHPVLPTVGATVPLKPQGTRWNGPCPWHGDHGRPNLYVFPATDTWHCFACGAHGDGLDWLARVRNVSLPTVIRTLSEVQTNAPMPTRVTTPPAATADQRHHTYTALLRAQPLTAAHRAWLSARRLDPERAHQRGYVSLWPGRAPVAPAADGVPGFYRAYDTWRLAGPAGLAIPVRDPAGRIQGLQIHADNPARGKYRWLSSPNRPGGASSGAPVHVTPGTGPVIWVTEGPLKADVLGQALSVRAVGVPGVSVWRRAVGVLRRCGPVTVVLAFDQDPVPATAAAVARQVEALAHACLAEGWRVEQARWDARFKGVDDALLAGAALDVTPWPK